ncbi:AAA family ATPase [Haloferula sp. A504]|uniref:AAA family ATPase n=1 Tax=Haloferula sp. A504 TaxID=3373601 RepID=UPI0031C5FB3B|nr:AAA family ATPase [Verrucomicrobiaceae bacterium E54]
MEPSGPPQPPPERLRARKLSELVVPRDQIKDLYKPVLIDGFLRKGEMAIISGGSKTQKTWLAHGMLVSVASGKPFVGLEICGEHRVLLVDYELDVNTLTARLSMFAGPGDRFEPAATWLDKVDVVSVRNERKERKLERFGAVEDIRALLQQAEDDHASYDLVVIDCLSRVPDVLEVQSEIDNHSLTKTLERFPGLCDEFGCGMVVMHHTAKGSGVGRDLIDRGRGGSALAAVPETIGSLIKDGGDGTWRQFEWVARTFKPTPRKVIVLDSKSHPARWVETHTDPVQPPKGGEGVGDNRQEILSVLRDLGPEEWITTAKLQKELSDRMVEMKDNTVRNHLKGLVGSKVVESELAGQKNTKRYRLKVGPVELQVGGGASGEKSPEM